MMQDACDFDRITTRRIKCCPDWDAHLRPKRDILRHFHSRGICNSRDDDILHLKGNHRSQNLRPITNAPAGRVVTGIRKDKGMRLRRLGRLQCRGQIGNRTAKPECMPCIPIGLGDALPRPFH